jgi:hypothetical protein
VAAVVGEGDRFRERHTQFGGARDPGGDLRDLDRVGQARPEVIVFRRDEDLALPGEAPPGPGMLDPIEVSLEAQPEGIRFLVARSGARTDGPRRTGSEHRVELGFAFLAATHTAPDVSDRLGMRAPDDDGAEIVDLHGIDIHRVSVTIRCDNFALDADAPEPQY